MQKTWIVMAVVTIAGPVLLAGQLERQMASALAGIEAEPDPMRRGRAVGYRLHDPIS